MGGTSLAKKHQSLGASSPLGKVTRVHKFYSRPLGKPVLLALLLRELQREGQETEEWGGHCDCFWPVLDG